MLRDGLYDKSRSICVDCGGAKQSSSRTKRCRDCHSKHFRGENHPNWGKSIPEMQGANNPSWKGVGEIYWRREVIKRDSGTCQKCSYSGTAVQAHHITPSSVDKELSNDVNNGITLCANCHCELHLELGTNYTIEEHNKFMEESNGIPTTL